MTDVFGGGGGGYKKHKDVLKSNLKACNIH